MPIEIQIEKKYGKNLPKEEVMAKCRAYAKEQVKSQMAGFQRLGVLGDWNDPYLTMRPETEAEEIRALGEILGKGFIYRGLKPVNGVLTARALWQKPKSNIRTASLRH